MRRRIALALDLEWPYRRHVDVFAGVMRYADEVGQWECVVDDYFEEALGRDKHGRPYDGAIGRITAAQSRAARRRALPIVNVWTSSPARAAPAVLMDHGAVGRLAAEHLLDRGLRAFACLRVKDNRGNHREADSFEKTAAEEGYACVTAQVDTVPAHTRSGRTRLRRALDQWMDRWTFPIGVFITQDHVGRWIAQSCRVRGWRVPDQVAIVAGHNERIICEQPPPTLTGIEADYDTIGYRAAALLDRLMRGEAPPRAARLVRPIGIVTRASTDFFAVDDPTVADAMRYISAHCHEPITVDDVAAAVITSRATLERRFREHMRMAVGAEIRRLRLERACRALVASDDPVASVARECGFAGPTQFSRSFHAAQGMTPSEYRRRHTAKRRHHPDT